MPSEACPGCGNLPGQGLTSTCHHPLGCEFWRSERRALGLDTKPGIPDDKPHNSISWNDVKGGIHEPEDDYMGDVE